MTTGISRVSKLVALITCVALLQACATSRFTPVTPGTTLTIRGGSDQKALPRAETLPPKTAGQYEFMAVNEKGETLYGVLPLAVNPGRIVLSALIFAPMIFIMGIRDPFNFYEVDPANRTLRYRENDAEPWRVYSPSHEESARAQVYFDAVARGCTFVWEGNRQTAVCPPGPAASTGQVRVAPATPVQPLPVRTAADKNVNE